MKIKATLAALALALFPAVAGAGCGSRSDAATCAEGQVWDTQTRSCISPVNS